MGVAGESPVGIAPSEALKWPSQPPSDATLIRWRRFFKGL